MIEQDREAWLETCSEEFRKGVQAHRDRVCLTKNPYDARTKQHVAWRNGWSDEDAEYLMNEY